MAEATLTETLAKQAEEAAKEETVKKSLADKFPCPEGDIFSLPTRADITNAFNEIASIPGELAAQVQGNKAAREKEIAELTALLENPDLTEEERQAILDEIEKKEKFIQTAIVEGLEKEVAEITETITDFVDTLEKALSPYWQKGQLNRDWQKEARDAFEELLAEFHTYIPTKIAELVSKLVPFQFNINVLGLQIDILRLVASPNYRKELQDQIAGKNFVTQIIAKQKQLAELKEKQKNPDLTLDEHADLQDQIDKLQEEIDDLYKKREELVDKFFNMIPEEFRQFDGEFGVVDIEAKAKLAWKYIKTEIKEWIQNAHVKAFQKLIGIFEEIWDLLGLPDLPFGELIAIMNLDIGALIREKIQSLKDKFEQSKLGKLRKINQLNKEIEELRKKLEDKDISMEDHIKFSEELEKKVEEKKTLEDDLLKEVREFHQGVLDAISSIQIFGYDILKMIGGKIESTVESIETKIAEISLEFQDFKMNWHKKILFEWVKIVKKFFSAIGLGALFEFLFLTWCDFLKLIGMPFAVPALAGVAGVLEVSQRETKTQPRPISSSPDVSDEVATYTADGETDTFASPSSSSGTLYVFKGGERQNFGVGGLGEVYMSGSSVVFRSTPAQGAFISIFRH